MKLNDISENDSVNMLKHKKVHIFSKMVKSGKKSLIWD